ncbi:MULTISPECIES: HIRAN domain-containing protein [unclassified Adlercreutzia]|uniref:HIRAN domain-containing protein n=1 Tax=unclassified Adlercreutzia TaxID=2636013 RepID=UPI0013EC4FD1|nr:MULTISPECIES: HIRAN domain-containing protein [unclassified Adlercreutzia]
MVTTLAPARTSRALCLVKGTTVAGTRHVAGVRDLVGGLQAGSRLAFERDRDNLYDEWAVRVLDGARNRIGYVSCECNEVVARLMDGGKHVFGVFEGASQVESWTRVEMGVYLDD